MKQAELKTSIVPQEFDNLRLDQAAAQMFDQYSRSQLKKWLEDGNLQLNSQKNLKPNQKVKAGDNISLLPELSEQVQFIAEKIDLNIVFEDEHILVLNKPAGLVMHPAVGHSSGTLLNALLYYRGEQQNIPRGGIVHRLDKDTSGILVVAKTLEAQASLVEQLRERTLGRIYYALVWGDAPLSGKIEFPIGRSENDRKKQGVTNKGKPALTYFKKIKGYKDFSLVECKLATGRTHQIRVHFAHIKMPLIGDKTYGRTKINKFLDENLAELLHNFARQALHAKKLSLIHPISKQVLEFETPLARDFVELLQKLDELTKFTK